MKQFHKQFSLRGKSAAGAEITSDMLAKVNAFALKELGVDDIYARKCLLAHNCIDRDVERFSEPLLDNFAATLPGKSLLFGHDRRNYLPMGLFFDATTEVMSADQFKALTGEEARLPEGATDVKVLWGWFYIAKTPTSADMITNFEAGVYRHVSIGFAASDLISVKKDINGPTQFYEYIAPGEALEGSLVWLGAQPGATAQKALKDQENDTKEVVPMKALVTLLVAMGFKFAVDANEEQVAAGIKSLLEEKDARIKALEKDAAEGKAYREDLVKTYVASKAKLGEVAETPEAQEGMKQVAGSYPLDFLKSEIKHLQARVEAKFPADFQTKGDEGNDQREKSDDNPLIPKAQK
jgi:hypothetical protein